MLDDGSQLFHPAVTHVSLLVGDHVVHRPWAGTGRGRAPPLAEPRTSPSALASSSPSNSPPDVLTFSLTLAATENLANPYPETEHFFTLVVVKSDGIYRFRANPWQIESTQRTPVSVWHAWRWHRAWRSLRPSLGEQPLVDLVTARVS